MDDPPATNSIQRFLEINQRLSGIGANVPKIFHYCETEGFVVLEDFGSSHYLHAITQTHRSMESRYTIYETAMTALSAIQNQADSGSLPGYNDELITTELGLFRSWYVEHHLNKKLSQQQETVFTEVVELCRHIFAEQPHCFVHRDYHSRNLMLTDSQAPGILDFQDAVLGPVTYDVVSLLRDCYFEWPEEFVEHFCQWHRRQLPFEVASEEYRRWFDITGMQRHLKVLGIFARLWYRDGRAQYLADLPLVLRHIRRIIPRYPELTRLGVMLDELHPS